MTRLSTRNIGARDAKRGETGPVLAFSSMEWHAFVTKIKDGDFDV